MLWVGNKKRHKKKQRHPTERDIHGTEMEPNTIRFPSLAAVVAFAVALLLCLLLLRLIMIGGAMLLWGPLSFTCPPTLVDDFIPD